MCFYILNEAGTIAFLNHTSIALIPNNAKLRKVTEFKPISLCNVIYRIVAKTIANKLKTIPHLIIDLSQNAFIPNKLIIDNIIIGYECLNKVKHGKDKKKKKGLGALKLDINKAL